jgi:hypothetical protein
MAGSEYDGTYGGNVGRTYKYDGSAWWTIWQRIYTPEHRAIAMYGPDAGYVLSRNSVVWHSDPSFTLTLASSDWVTDNYLYGIWAFAADDIYAVGERGTILHYDGTQWTAQTSNTTQGLRAIWGSAPDDIYAVGDAGTMVHNNGTGWSAVAHGIGSNNLGAIWGTSGDNIEVAAGPGKTWYYEGSAWTVQDAWPEEYGEAGSLWASGADDWYAVTNWGALHKSPLSWEPVNLGGRRVRDVHGVSATEVYFLTGSGGVPIASAPAGEAAQVGITQGFELLRYNGTDYTVVYQDPVAAFQRLWALGSKNVFLVGRLNNTPAFGHFDGSNLVVDPVVADLWLYGMCGLGDTVWSCGANGSVATSTRN